MDTNKLINLMKTIALAITMGLTAFCALGQNPISIRTTNGQAVGLNATGGLTVTGGLTADTITGNGAGLTNLQTGVSQSYSNRSDFRYEHR